MEKTLVAAPAEATVTHKTLNDPLDKALEASQPDHKS
jgi:hypothetical protein